VRTKVLALPTKVPSKSKVAKLSVASKKVKLNKILLNLDYNQDVIQYFKTLTSAPGKFIILEGADGLGKSTLLKNLELVNSKLNSQYFDLHNFDQFLTAMDSKKIRSFHDLCCIHLCEHFPLSEIQQKQFILMLQEKLKYASVVLSTRNYGHIKKMLPGQLWSNSLLMKLGLPSKSDLQKFTHHRADQLNILGSLDFLQQKVNELKTFAQINHLLVNFKEFGKEAVILKRTSDVSELKTDYSQEEISKLLGGLCQKYAIAKIDLLSRSRKKEIVACKQRVYFELKCKYHFSYPQIAKFFNIDHTTVMYSVNKIRKLKE
jgi:energy-coupling factor transporter ATP-binding protein EcfA2